MDDETQLHQLQNSHLGPSSVKHALPVTLTYERHGQTPKEDVKDHSHEEPAVPTSNSALKGRIFFILFLHTCQH